MLTIDAWTELAATAAGHERLELRKRIADGYVHVVRGVAATIARGNPYVEFGDLISDGAFGLLDAVDRFDPRRGVRFETFASRRVWGAMLDGIRERDPLTRAMRASEEAPAIFSIDVPGRGDRNRPMTRADQLADGAPAPVVPLGEHDAIVRLLAGLPPDLQPLMQLYYEDDYTMLEIAQWLGVSESRISQMHTLAMGILRAQLSQPDLEPLPYGDHDMTEGNNNGNGNHNGRGHGTLSKRTQDVQVDPPIGDVGGAALMELPPWLKALRDAMGSAIQGDDLKEIMAAQIKKAKEGNMQAAQFVMNQAHKMLAAEQKRITVVQNNFYNATEDKRPDTPLEPDDDRERQLNKLSARAAARQRIASRAGDRSLPRPVSDDEEKALRRKADEVDE